MVGVPAPPYSGGLHTPKSQFYESYLLLYNLYDSYRYGSKRRPIYDEAGGASEKFLLVETVPSVEYEVYAEANLYLYVLTDVGLLL